MKYLIINDRKYDLIKDYKNGFSLDAVTEKITEYFYMYDYIVGDWSYGKLRLKGFCKKDNKSFRKTNDYNQVDDYIQNYCAFDCRHFILENLDVAEPMDMDEI